MTHRDRDNVCVSESLEYAFYSTFLYSTGLKSLRVCFISSENHWLIRAALNILVQLDLSKSHFIGHGLNAHCATLHTTTKL